MMKSAWIKGKLILATQERGCCFTACENCHKSLDADITWIVTCRACKVQSEVEARSRLTVIINDGTGSILATLCTHDVEDFISFTSIQLKEAEENVGVLIGKAGETIRTLQNSSGASIQITRDAEADPNSQLGMCN